MLLEANADVDEPSKTTGATPLFIAAGKGHVEMLRLLIDAGADKDAATTDFGLTPLFIAVQNNHIEAAGLLIDSGVNVVKTLSVGQHMKAPKT